MTAYLLASTVSGPLYGKLGDLYGRKTLLQIAIVLFLIGSALCGSRPVDDRADRVPRAPGARRRRADGHDDGRRRRHHLAARPRPLPGLSSAPCSGLRRVIGPLLGGFLVDSLSWRWIFYVNLPLGARRVRRDRRRCCQPTARPRSSHRSTTWARPAATAGLSAIVLFTSLGGTSYGVDLADDPRADRARRRDAGAVPIRRGARRRADPAARAVPQPGVRGLRARSASSSASRCSVRSRTCRCTSRSSRAHSPTESGLLFLPLMGGLLVTSILERPPDLAVRSLPVVPDRRDGADDHRPVPACAAGRCRHRRVTASLYMLVMGLGLGMVMQVLVLAVQNAVDYKYLGVATSGSTLFRQIGGSIGVSAFGAIFSNDLATELAKRIPPGVAPPGAANPGGRQAPAAGDSRPLRRCLLGGAAPGVPRPRPGSPSSASRSPGCSGSCRCARPPTPRAWARAFATPHHHSSEREIERILSSLMQREERERVYERLIDRSGIDITPPEGWLLRRIAERSGRPSRRCPIICQRAAVARSCTIPLASLARRGYISTDPDRQIELTPAGQAASDQLLAAGREQLCRLLDGWEPEHDEDLQPVLRRLAGALVVEMPGR